MRTTKSLLAVGLGMTLALAGCAAGPPKPADVTLQLKADNPINDGILLPIDIMTVDENKAASVLSLSPDEWFGSRLREQLTPDEIQKVAIRGGGTRSVPVKVNSQTGRIIVYADYEATSQRDQQQLVIDASKQALRDSYVIHVKTGELELSP